MSYSKSGCFSGIARLLCCKGSLQTHPSDEPITATQTEFDLHDLSNVKTQIEASLTTTTSTTHGVVAKLMGLDSLPHSNYVAKTPDLVTRSRSFNFIDYLLDFDLSREHHRSVNTSVSFREVPTVLTPENRHDFFLLYLDDVEKNKKNASRSADNKKQKKIEKNKKEKNQRNQKLKDELSNNKKVSRLGSCKGSQGFVSPSKRNGITVKKAKNQEKPIDQKGVLVESKFTKRIKIKQSSPVLVHHELPLSANNSSPIESNDIEHKRVVKNDYIKVARKLCKFTEEDIKKSNWETRNVLEFERFEEICLNLGQQILELQVEQVVEELVGFELFDGNCL